MSRIYYILLLKFSNKCYQNFQFDNITLIYPLPLQILLLKFINKCY